MLNSEELVTEFTLQAERQTQKLTGVTIDSKITVAEGELRGGNQGTPSRELVQNVKMLNRRMFELVNGLIEFKEQILRNVTSCRLYTFNYPLLIEHILREAKLYRSIIAEIEQKGCITSEKRKEMEQV